MSLDSLFDRSQRFMELGEAVPGHKPMEAHDIATTQKITASAESESMIRGTMIDGPKWLPYAAEKYQISASIKDYVLVPVTIMYTDLPNRNMVSFPFTELTSFNVGQAQLAYQTWKGRPTHVEHANQDPTKAKGVVFSVGIRPVRGFQGDLHKIVTLLGFDRNRDSVLANKILSGASNNYSMGALCNDYRCSVCNASMARSNGHCDHLDIRSAEGRLAVREFGGKLAYRMAIEPTAIEVSAVGVPAYHMATSRPL